MVVDARETRDVIEMFNDEWYRLIDSGKIDLTQPRAQGSYPQGVIPLVFGEMVEHRRNCELSEFVLTACAPEEVPEVFDAVLPPNRTDEIIFLALERCELSRLDDIYLNLSPNKTSDRRIVEAYLNRYIPQAI